MACSQSSLGGSEWTRDGHFLRLLQRNVYGGTTARHAIHFILRQLATLLLLGLACLSLQSLMDLQLLLIIHRATPFA